ncbi:hypothetical protein GCM10007424_02510 [Flavobacterium suaedae]|uniref:Uncharacterized protein n=1 Tax=Flavobacterium suaedae TaxID=1767027 RepID=A0ABQ1JGZ3_9FLAO|nr:hypothetical protein GCM10007424_02510 [Flavobacterium suaedae]
MEEKFSIQPIVHISNKTTNKAKLITPSKVLRSGKNNTILIPVRIIVNNDNRNLKIFIALVKFSVT